MSDRTDYSTPYGLAVRGTVLVVPGRGETRISYHRFATRLAADAYAVRVIDPRDNTDSLASALTAATAGVVARPLVLIGADAGAAAVAALLSQEDASAPWWPDAVVLAGIPGHAAAVSGGWDIELGVRTACPVHRRVLSADLAGALSIALPDQLLDAALDATADIPRLVLVGDADPLADREALARSVKAAPRARLTVVHGAHHDVLNDIQHRSVAAEVVGFLETVRNDLAPVLTVESSAW